MHSMRLQEPHFTNVLTGKKIYETRVNDPKRQKMNIGDIIKIRHNDDKKKTYMIVITERKLYKTFRDAIVDSGVKKVLPNTNSTNNGIKLYESFPGYIEGAKQYGVVRFTLVVNNDRKTHNLTIKNPKKCPTFYFIVSGKKTVEGRKNSPTYQKYKPGDFLNFIWKKKNCMTLITKINKYSDVKEYLQKETLKRTLPCVKTLEIGIKMYNQWTRPSEINTLRQRYGHGFLGIHIIVF